MVSRPDFGAVVLSFDFELHWGQRDRRPLDDQRRQHYLAARAAIPRILEQLEQYQIAATWATVGFLFATGATEWRDARPGSLPSYLDPRLSPYGEAVGADEATDPFHFAPSLIARIRDTPNQELATHTHSHYYCAAPGQTAEQFDADLAAARSIADRRGVRLSSIVFPRNQHNPAYDPILGRHGLTALRGPARGWMYRPTPRSNAWQRAARLVDAHLNLSGHHTYGWDELAPADGRVDVRASWLLRPTVAGRSALGHWRRRRILAAIEDAARHHRLVHLWCHPHNFADDTVTALAEFEAVLACIAAARSRHGLRSMTMAAVSEQVSGQQAGG